MCLNYNWNRKYQKKNQRFYKHKIKNLNNKYKYKLLNKKNYNAILKTYKLIMRGSNEKNKLYC